MQSQFTCQNNDHFMHARYPAQQILQGSRRMFSASELTLSYHIQWPKTFRSPIYAYCNHCNASQPAGTISILYILTILLGKHCRGHAECSRPRTQQYTTIFDDRTHSGVTFMHTVSTAIQINLPKKWPFMQPQTRTLYPNTAWQTFQGSCQMVSASDPTLSYHIRWPKTFRTPIYAYCSQCNHNQPAGTMTILCMLTILLGKYCRGHAKCSRPQTQYQLPYSMTEDIPESHLCIL